MKKAILGVLFLAPLLLPTATRAGGFDDWVHSWFRNSPHPGVRPVAPGYGYDPRNPYRPYDPYRTGGVRPGDPLGDPRGGDPQDPGNSAPIDGGMVLLLMAGLGLGVVRVYAMRKRAAVAPLG